MVPVWSSAPPASLAMFKGPYAVAAMRIWVPIHPITVALLVAALALNWKTPRRKPNLVVLGGYVAVLVVTFAYFVPEILAITGSPYSDSVDPELTSRAKFWESLSLVRLALILVLAVLLLLGLSARARARKARKSKRRWTGDVGRLVLRSPEGAKEDVGRKTEDVSTCPLPRT